MSPLKPLMKNFLFITMMIKERIICSRPRPTGLPSNQAGTGQPHITCPMEKYMSTHKKPMEVRSLLMRTGVSWSSRASSSAFSLSDWLKAWPLTASDLRLAPYPASVTAFIIAELSAAPSTLMELVSRLTAHSVTPGTFETAFSTLAWQAAQLMPVII